MQIAQTEGRSLRRIVSTMARLVLAALLVASVLAPLVRVVPESGTAESLAITDAISTLFTDPAEVTRISGKAETADWGATLAVALGAVRIAIALLVLGGIGVAVSAVWLLGSPETGHRAAVAISAAVLSAGALLLAAGAAVLPVDDGDAGPAWGLWLPIAAAVWVLALYRPLADLNA